MLPKSEIRQRYAKLKDMRVTDKAIRKKNQQNREIHNLLIKPCLSKKFVAAAAKEMTKLRRMRASAIVNEVRQRVSCACSPREAGLLCA